MAYFASLVHHDSSSEQDPVLAVQANLRRLYVGVWYRQRGIGTILVRTFLAEVGRRICERWSDRACIEIDFHAKVPDTALSVQKLLGRQGFRSKLLSPKDESEGCYYDFQLLKQVQGNPGARVWKSV
jgi:hypothetical protein